MSSTPSPWRTRLAALSPAAGRTRGEWATDSVLFAVAVLVWAEAARTPVWSYLHPAWRALDVTLGAIATAAVWWTRRHPLGVGVLMIIPGALAISASAGALIAVYRMGLIARVRPAITVTAITILAAIPYHALFPLPGMTWLVWLIIIPLMYALSLCIGLLGRAHRNQLRHLREAAERERERYEQRLATIRQDERERIAREMHDVLAHRISLLSMHAGALEYRARSATPPSPAELTDAAGVIRESAQAAVEDLRELLGLLRSDDELGTGAPQPRIDDLPTLVHDAAAAGQRVDLVVEVKGERLRESAQRTAYRVVQEALTNARKHAPHVPVTVRVGKDGGDLTITATNPVPPGFTRWDLPPAGNGLIGLAERVRIDGGSFDATVADGQFRLRASLPLGAT